MAPGVLHNTSLLDLHSEASSSLVRSHSSRRDSAPVTASGHSMDRAVGGHLSLAKRNSTPAVSASASMGVVPRGGARDSSSSGSSSMEHRRLDRCHSEPVKGGGNSSRYKTELCRPFEEHGFCKYGDKCQFAHGSPELRTLSRHPKYKTELCRTFHTIGFCPYGPRCHFIHNAEERRGNSVSSCVGPLSPTSPSSPIPGQQLTDRPHLLAMAGLGGAGLGLGASGSAGLSPTFAGLPSGYGAGLGGLGNGLGSTAESPSPPASIHGSPTAPSTFFDESFSLFPGASQGLLETLSVGLHSLTPIPQTQGTPNSLPGLETPPVSPVESLAGDLDSLSLSSSSHSTSPTPHSLHAALTHAHALEISRTLRLPIFEQLCEHD